MNRYLPLLMTLPLAACGGGGGSSPSTTPAVSSVPAAANSAVGQNGNINGTDLKSTGPGPYPLQAITAHMDPGTGPTNGGVSITDTATGTVDVTFDPTTNKITSVTYHQDSAAHELLGLDGVTVTNPQSVPKITKDMISTALQGITPNVPIVIGETLNYSGFGLWATAIKTNPPGGANDGVTAVGVFATGSPTPLNAVPKTGTATFTGDAAGYASIPKPAGDPHTNGTLNMAFDANAMIGVDFGKAAVNASITNIQAVSMDSIATKATLPNLSGNGTLAGNTYSTTLAGGSLTGSLNGTLMGPQAQETAGTFSASGGGTTIVGGFAAKR